MLNKIKTKKNHSGFTLIEALVFLFVFSLITLSFYGVITVGVRYITISKNRLSALAIANEKMEIIRNLAYADVGIQGGACSGNIPQEEDVNENGRTFHVETMAAYVDDPFDGLLGSDPNEALYFKDYKIVQVDVSWNNSGTDQGSVTLTSRFVPPGLETASTGDGILFINVFSDQGTGGAVEHATVHVVNNDLGFNETRQTDDAGNVMIVGAKESINRYAITVSKSGYETVETYIPYPDTQFNPVDTHASVYAGQPNTTNIIQNKTADLKIKIADTLGIPIENVSFNLSGGRKLGTMPVAPFMPVYNLNVTEDTNSSGEKEFNEISPGQYNLGLVETGEYVLVGFNDTLPFTLLSDDNLEVKAKITRKDATGLSVSVIDAEGQSPISGAQVKLTGNGYDETAETDEIGMAFFPAGENPGYNLEVTRDGFNNFSESVDISGSVLTAKKISLTIPN